MNLDKTLLPPSNTCDHSRVEWEISEPKSSPIVTVKMMCLCWGCWMETTKTIKPMNCGHDLGEADIIESSYPELTLQCRIQGCGAMNL